MERNLRNPGAPAPVMQGFLPHVYKHCLPGATLDFTALDGLDYLTPRGTLKMAASPDGRFAYAYRFSGMLPYYAAPSAEFAAGDNPFRPERLEELLRRRRNIRCRHILGRQRPGTNGSEHDIRKRKRTRGYL